MAAAKTGISEPVYGPIVQVSTDSDSDVADDEATDIDDDNVTDSAIQNIVDRAKAITLTDGDDDAATAAAKPTTSKDTAGKAAHASNATAKAAASKDISKAAASKDTAKATTSRAGGSKGTFKTPSFKCNSRKSLYTPPSYKSFNTRISHKSKPRKTSYIVQDLVTVATGASANATAGIKLLKSSNGHEMLCAGEHYFTISTIRWKCGFIENGCYHWMCVMNRETFCRAIIKTTIIDGFHRVLKEINPKSPQPRHNHVPMPIPAMYKAYLPK